LPRVIVRGFAADAHEHGAAQEDLRFAILLPRRRRAPESSRNAALDVGARGVRAAPRRAMPKRGVPPPVPASIPLVRTSTSVNRAAASSVASDRHDGSAQAALSSVSPCASDGRFEHDGARSR
jgi:hypothetical protein